MVSYFKISYIYKFIPKDILIYHYIIYFLLLFQINYVTPHLVNKHN